jgi:flavin-dependent dehydrogenase
MGAGHIDADVVVVGGGPAGAATAIACATRGKRVVLVERDLFAREHPGETLHPGVEPLLMQLGIAERLASVVGARHDGIWIEWGGPSRFMPFGNDDSGPWSGFQVWRARFDALLLTRARELGVDVRQPAKATGLVPSGGVTTDFGIVSSRMLVDASGRSRWLGRLLGVSSPARSPRLHARYGYAEGMAHSAMERLRWSEMQVAGPGQHGFDPEPTSGLGCAWTDRRRMVSGCPRSSEVFWRPRHPVGRM